MASASNRLLGASLVPLVGLVLLPPVWASDPAAAALAQRFFAHLDSNRPIAGVFEISTTMDTAIRGDMQKQAEQSLKGKRKVVLSGDSTLLCRWAWDKEREVTEALPGSTGADASFLRNQEANLIEMIRGSYNIESPGEVSIWRPASFYFLASQKPWAQALEECEFVIEKPGGDAAAGVVTLRATKRNENMTFALTMDAASCVLKGATIDFNSKRFLELDVDAVVKGADHRVFPERATLKLYDLGHPERPYRIQRLAAKGVTFPSAGTQINSLLNFSLSNGALVSDRIVDRLYRLQAPASAVDVIAGSAKWMPVGETKRAPETIPRN